MNRLFAIAIVGLTLLFPAARCVADEKTEAQLGRLLSQRTELLGKMERVLGKDAALDLTDADERIVHLRALEKRYREYGFTHPKGGGRPASLDVLTREIALQKKTVAALVEQDIRLGNSPDGGPQTREARARLVMLESRLKWVKEERLNVAVSRNLELKELGISTYDQLLAEVVRLETRKTELLARDPMLKNWLAAYRRLDEERKNLEAEILGRGRTLRRDAALCDPAEEVRDELGIKPGDDKHGTYRSALATPSGMFTAGKSVFRRRTTDHCEFKVEFDEPPLTLKAGQTFEITVTGTATIREGDKNDKGKFIRGNFGKFDLNTAGLEVLKGPGLAATGFEVHNNGEATVTQTVKYKFRLPQGARTVSLTFFLWNVHCSTTWTWNLR
jgi:hypothetical protein